MLSLRWELSACLKWWTNPTSPNLNIGPWTSNCWMSSSTELAPCCSMELLPCSCLSIWIHKYEANLGFKLVHHHWCPRRVEDLLYFMHCPSPTTSALPV